MPKIFIPIFPISGKKYSIYRTEIELTDSSAKWRCGHMNTTASQALHSFDPDKLEKVMQSFVEISTEAEYFAVIISLELNGSLPSANKFLTFTCKD